MNDEIIAENLKIFGEKKFRKNTDFAKALDMMPQSLDKYLKGISIPGGLILKKLAQLGCDINWLLTGESYKSPEAELMDKQDRERLDKHGAQIDELKEAVKVLGESFKELTETNTKILEHLRSIDREQRNFRSRIKELENKNGF